jgi:hypothetical protein
MPGRGNFGQTAAAAIVLALPTLAAIWFLSYFVTQDGPAHQYTAELLARLIGGDSWLASQVHLQAPPLPNYLAQFILAALTVLPGRAGDQILMSLTIVGLAVAILWLRHSVQPHSPSLLIVPFAVLLTMGRLWLLGFYGFLLGVALFCITLGWWWRRHDRLTLHWSALLSLLLILGWFAHLVSYAVTIGALAIFTLARFERRHATLTFLGAIPSLLLAAWYALVMASHGSFAPHYLRMETPSIRAWLQHLRSIKLISIADQTRLPFLPMESSLFVVLAPAILTGIAVLIWTIATRRTSNDAQPGGKVWAMFAVALLIAALVAPDSFGAEHGGFLRERLFLLGLVSAVPAWSLGPSRRNRVASVLVVIGLAVQTLFVWEYGVRSSEQVRTLMTVAHAIPDGSRVYVIRPRLKTEFRASPTLHAANLLGLDKRVIVWNNYQANLYYFPVIFQEPFIPCSDTGECELRENWRRNDLVVLWRLTPDAHAEHLPWFPRVISDSGHVTVYGRP